MALTVKVTTAVDVGDGAATTPFATSLAARSRVKTDSTLTDGGSKVVTLTAGQNKQIDLGSIATARLLMFEFPSEVLLRTGAADNDAISLKPMSSGTVGVAVLECSVADGVWLENADDSNAIDVTVTSVGV